MKIRFPIALALLGMAQSAAAQTSEPAKCLGVLQAEALVTYLLPKAIDASRAACSTSLTASSALMVKNSKRLANYRAASESAWPEAKSAVTVLAGEKLPQGMDDAVLRPIADAMFSQLIGQEIKAKDCALIDKIYSDLEPMPASNLASLAITIVQASAKDGKKQGIAICKATA